VPKEKQNQKHTQRKAKEKILPYLCDSAPLRDLFAFAEKIKSARKATKAQRIRKGFFARHSWRCAVDAYPKTPECHPERILVEAGREPVFAAIVEFTKMLSA